MPKIGGIEVSQKGYPVALTLLDLRKKIGSNDKWIVAAVEEDGAIDFEILWKFSPDVAWALIKAGIEHLDALEPTGV